MVGLGNLSDLEREWSMFDRSVSADPACACRRVSFSSTAAGPPTGAPASACLLLLSRRYGESVEETARFKGQLHLGVWLGSTLEGRRRRGAKLILTGLAETDDAASFCCALSVEIKMARVARIRAAERRQSVAWRVNARRVHFTSPASPSQTASKHENANGPRSVPPSHPEKELDIIGLAYALAWLAPGCTPQRARAGQHRGASGVFGFPRHVPTQEGQNDDRRIAELTAQAPTSHDGGL